MTGASEHRRRKQRKERIEKESAAKEAEKLKREAKTSNTRRRRRKSKPKETAIEAVPETVEEKEPKRRHGERRSTRRKVPEDRKDVEYPEKSDIPKGTLPKKLRKTLDERFIFDVMAAMKNNQSLVIVKKDENTWTLGLGRTSAVENMVRLSGKAYLDEVLSHEYQAHMEGWGELPEEEKIQIAQRAGTEWDEHNNHRINLMRCGDAYRKLLKIEKYKPEYRALAARKAIRVRRD